MKILWLTLADPFPPTNGQYLYSYGLMRSVAKAGAELHVLGFGRPGGAHRDGQIDGNVHWSLADHRPQPKLLGMLSSLPHLSCRTRTADFRHKLDAVLNQAPPDAVVFDSASIGWALEPILGRWGNGRPRLIYLAHNHESNIARITAKGEPNPIKRLFKSYDASRMVRLETRLVRAADLVSSNSEIDQRSFELLRGRQVEFAPAGYDGWRAPPRSIDGKLPRRVVILGSFHWPPKRRSIESFVRAADPLFAAAGIELQIVGNIDGANLERLRDETAATRFLGFVNDPIPLLAGARLALVPDTLGGFKLKSLDYVFNRLPIFAIDRSVPGLPLAAGDSIRYFRDHEALAHGVVDAIDDFDTLNHMQERAYAACDHRFEWADIGKRLLDAIASLEPPNAENVTSASGGVAFAPRPRALARSG